MQPPKTSTCYLYNTYNTKHCYCLHCGFPAIQPAQTIASCPHDLSIRSFKRSSDVSSKCEQAAARIDHPRCTSEQQLKVNSLKRKSRTPENVTDIKTRDVWFRWGYECYPDIHALVKVTSPSEGLSFPGHHNSNHINCCCSVYMDVLYCVVLCCIVLWSSVMYPMRHGIMASPLGQGMAPA